MADILLSFRNCDSFAFEDKTHVNSTKVNKELTITFPDGNILTFTESEWPETIPSTGIGDLGYDGHEILGDLDEWGMNYSTTISANIEVLTEDIVDNPAMFKDSSGENTSFTYTYFPSGVYHAEYSYSTGDPTDLSYSYKSYILHKDTATNYLKEKIEWLFTYDTEADTTQYEYDLVQKQVMQMIMLMHIAEFEFDANSYTEANLKLLACDKIYSTGEMSYKYDEARL